MTKLSAERIKFSSGATSLLLSAVFVVAVFACAMRAGAQSPPLSDTERTAIADTIAQLSREKPAQPRRSIDCEELLRRGRAALPQDVGGRNSPDWNLVSEGQIFSMSTNEKLAEACKWTRSIRQERRSSDDEILDQKIHVLSRDAAYLVSNIRETIHWADGRTTIRPMAITQILARSASGWQQVHTHESWPAEGK